MPNPDLLERYPLLHSTNAGEFGDAIVKTYGAAKAYAPEPTGFDGCANFLKLQGIKLGFMRFGVPVVAEYSESSDYRQRFVLSGTVKSIIGGKDLDIGEHESLVITSGRSSAFHFSSDFAQLKLIVDATAVERKLTALLGAKPKRRIEFFPTANQMAGRPRLLRDLVLFLARQLDSASIFPPLLLQELEQAIIVAFISSNANSFSDLLEKDESNAAPAQVRLAEEYIEANWSKAITIEELVEITGVNVRSLYRSFEKTRGFGPKAFLKKVRLEKARQRLLSGYPETSVLEVALQCGFGNLGHFARDYQNAFGELPSQSLSRAPRIKL